MKVHFYQYECYLILFSKLSLGHQMFIILAPKKNSVWWIFNGMPPALN